MPKLLIQSRAQSYKMTQHPLSLSRGLPSRLLLRFVLLPSSSSIISAGRTDMCTTLGLSVLNWYSANCQFIHLKLDPY